MQNKPSKWVPGFKHSPRSSNTQAFQMGLFLNVPTGKFEPIDSSWDNVHSGGLFISGANKIYFRDETNKDTYINSPADDQLALYASTVLIAKDTDGDGTGLVVSNLDTNNPPMASTIDMLEIGTVFGTADTYGFRLKYDGDTNNLEVQSGYETTVNTRMVIERDTGNVGIGVIPEAWEAAHLGLQLGPASALWCYTGSPSNTTATYLGNNAYYDGAYKRVITDAGSVILQDSDGNIVSKVFVSGAADSAITFIDAQTIDVSGNITVNTGNLVIGTAGKGIDFRNQTATIASDTSVDAELLDHYEEGRFTAVLEDGAGNAATTVNIPSTLNASYVRIGSVVHINGFLNISSVSAFVSGNCKITGLPFVIGTGSTGWAYSYLSGGFGFGYASGLSLSAAGGVFGITENNSSQIDLYVSDSTTAYTPLAYDEIGDSSQLIWTTTYTTATA